MFLAHVLFGSLMGLALVIVAILLREERQGGYFLIAGGLVVAVTGLLLLLSPLQIQTGLTETTVTPDQVITVFDYTPLATLYNSFFGLVLVLSGLAAIAVSAAALNDGDDD